MIEGRSLQWSRGSRTAQLFVPPGKEGFGKSSCSKRILAVRNPDASQNAPALPESSYFSVTGFRWQEGQIQEPRKEVASYRNRGVSQN